MDTAVISQFERHRYPDASCGFVNEGFIKTDGDFYLRMYGHGALSQT